MVFKKIEFIFFLHENFLCVLRLKLRVKIIKNGDVMSDFSFLLTILSSNN